MEKSLKSLVVVVAVASTTAFFDYHRDCMQECQRQNLPCTISEISPQFFPCDCILTADACLSRASPEVVCLQPDASPSGGSEIWLAFWNYTHPNPPRPVPVPTHETSILQIYSAVVTTLLIVYGCTNLFQCAAQTWRRRRYACLEPQRAPSSGVPQSPESPYGSTTHDI